MSYLLILTSGSIILVLSINVLWHFSSAWITKFLLRALLREALNKNFGSFKAQSSVLINGIAVEF